MTVFSTADLIASFRAICVAIEAAKEHLSVLDGAIGDGDHGVTMAMGFKAVNSALNGTDRATANPADVFNAAAKSFLNAVGASSGPLYATGFMRAGAAVKGRTDLDSDAVVSVLAAMAQGIQDRGKGAAGDKTMLDAWLPAAEAAKAARAQGGDIGDCLAAAAAAARTGAESTMTMIASKGRASRLGERARGHIDPGAASAAIILQAWSDWAADPRRAHQSNPAVIKEADADASSLL